MRDVLSWQMCDICHRRLVTTTCRVDGTVLRLCPYCAASLSQLLHCGAQQSPMARSRRAVGINEGLIGSLREEAESSHSYRRRSRKAS